MDCSDETAYLESDIFIKSSFSLLHKTKRRAYLVDLFFKLSGLSERNALLIKLGVLAKSEIYPKWAAKQNAVQYDPVQPSSINISLN